MGFVFLFVCPVRQQVDSYVSFNVGIQMIDSCVSCNVGIQMFLIEDRTYSVDVSIKIQPVQVRVRLKLEFICFHSKIEQRGCVDQ